MEVIAARTPPPYWLILPLTSEIKMSTQSNRIRYATRETDHGYWLVYDIFSGETVTLNNMALEILDEDEAGDWANELNRDYCGLDSGTRH